MLIYTNNMNKITKKQRQKLLKEVIATSGIGDQQHLLASLQRRGVETRQATVSRDLQEMGFIKVRQETGVYRYELFEKPSESLIWEKLKVLFENFVSDIRSTNNLILIRTSPGNANGVASLIDGLQRHEILGTLAGDDTILVVIDTEENRQVLEQEFRRLL